MPALSPLKIPKPTPSVRSFGPGPALLPAIAPPVAASAPLTGSRSNTVFALSDDLGDGDISTRGNPPLQTSNTDRLCAGLVATGASPEPSTCHGGFKRLYLDVSREYSLLRRLALFINLRNTNKPSDDLEIIGSNTPAHAQFRSRLDFGSLWTFGLKGTF